MTDSNIIEPLRSLTTDISKLSSDPANARLHDERNIDSIRGSLALFGQRKPIVVRKKGSVVIAGNGTLAAAKALGWETIAAVFVDDDTAMATAYGIADNRTAELASWDNMTLGTLLGGLQDTAINMESLGFTNDEMAELIGNVDLSPSITEPLEKQNNIECPKCGHNFVK